MLAIPAGDVVAGYAAGGGELTARDKLAVVNREGVDRVAHPLSQRLPLLAVPAGDAATGRASSSRETTAGDELTVVKKEGPH